MRMQSGEFTKKRRRLLRMNTNKKETPTRADFDFDIQKTTVFYRATRQNFHRCRISDLGDLEVRVFGQD